MWLVKHGIPINLKLVSLSKKYSEKLKVVTYRSKISLNLVQCISRPTLVGVQRNDQQG